MIARSSCCRMVSACCGVVLSLTTACSRWIELVPVPTTGDGSQVHTIAQREQVPLILDRIRVTRNGAPYTLSIEAEQWLLGSLTDIGLFARLGTDGNSDPLLNEKNIRARVQIDEALDPHPGEAAWKGFVIGASMFTLTPFMPLEYDYAAHVMLELERWDGQIKRYESQSAGTARYQLFGATPLMIDELKGHVTESCLIALMQQLVRDTSFYMASSAPLSENPIRSVSVKGRRPEPPAISVVPISTTTQK